MSEYRIDARRITAALKFFTGTPTKEIERLASVRFPKITDDNQYAIGALNAMLDINAEVDDDEPQADVKATCTLRKGSLPSWLDRGKAVRMFDNGNVIDGMLLVTHWTEDQPKFAVIDDSKVEHPLTVETLWRFIK